MKLYKLAYARSGDKGCDANIGIVALGVEEYEFLKKYLTEEAVKSYFKPLGVKEVKRFELPKLYCFNFILTGILGAGGSQSLRIDAQGKALGSAILEMELVHE